MANLYHFPPTPNAAATGYKVCVAVTGSSPAEMLERASNVLISNHFLELRLDSLPDPKLLPPLLAPLLQQHPKAKLIATCRRTMAGGNFPGSLAEELAILESAAQAGCSIVDLALESAEAMLLDQHRLFRQTLFESNTSLLISHHDYEETRDLELNFERLSRFLPEIVKLVSTATSLADNLAMLRLLSAPHPVPVVGIAMGEPGIVSRVLGPRSGALFTFASSSAGEETAPGQATASTLRELYHIDQINRSTRVYGVAGMPVSHSLSPLLHNTGFHTLGVNAVFLPLVTGSVDDLLRLTRELPLEGLSITMPLKQVILPLLDHVDPLAAKVGACNTVVRMADGGLHGYNTDVAGVIAPLEKRLSLAGARVLVQGAGGAARAAVFGLLDKGAQVWITNRTSAAAAVLAAESGAQAADPSILTPGNFDVLVHATPAGMGVPAGQPSEALDDTALPAKLIFDMVYRPLETPLIRRARAQGLPVITGEEMFVHQGARQLELWTNQPAPESELFRVVLEALRSPA